MKVSTALNRVDRIVYTRNSPPVVETAARELIDRALKKATIHCKARAGSGPGVLRLFVKPGKKDGKGSIRFQISEDGSASIIASQANLLFSFVHYLLDKLSTKNVGRYSKGVVFTPAFRWQRSTYDFFLTQEGRVQRNFNRETYVRELARLGFTHAEVNALASPMALESGPKGETYPMFYTYCPALDQFVYSELNKGTYPHYYLSANLARLKENAALAVKYGLTPGLLCFEPRSVPESFFERYPMLRGARVDHPIRSFKPRYNMTIVHPAVRDHYREMMVKLMKEVPQLGYISIWANDSGAGFEHTKSLYVGRNGGAYLIREWNDDETIARLAGENALRFLRVLRDGGREVNPDFRVLTRLESFYGEHDTVWEGLGEGMDVETSSLVARGWDMPYVHPRYPDSAAIPAGTVYHQGFDEKETPPIRELASREGRSHFYFSVGPHWTFEPLLGVPSPCLTVERLKSLRHGGVEDLAHAGGSFPAELVPYNINHEMSRAFTYDPAMDVTREVTRLARKWAGKELADDLAQAWKLAEEAILAFPVVTPLYSALGFTWYRLWARPLVPNLEKVAKADRAYYEDFMCTTPHNTNNVDLSRDVLFHLTTPAQCKQVVERMDKNLWAPLDKAIRILRASDHQAVMHDQRVRLEALRCWFMTQRNVAAWVAGVYGYMAARKKADKVKHKAYLQDMIDRELKNTKALQSILDEDVEFMAVADEGETPLMYGAHLKSLLQKRMELMERHRHDEPFIDHCYMERKAAELL